VQASINGNVVNMLLDTGAQATLVTPGTAARLGLPRDRRRTTNLIGIGGSVASQNALIQDFAVAGSERLDLSVGVSTLPASDRTDGLIGADILSVYDLDLDFPGRMLTLYNVTGCEQIVPVWDRRYATVPAHLLSRLLLVQIEIDGHPLSTLFDTGGRGVMLSRAAVPLVGLTDGDLALDPPEESRGIGARRTPSSLHRFAAVRIGAETFHNVPVHITEFHQVQANMLLGMDYMIGRRFWISYATHTVFIQVPATATSQRSSQAGPGR
jgi:predicted aspartyl protease